MALGAGGTGKDGCGEGGGSGRSRCHGMEVTTGTAAPLPPSDTSSVGHAAGRASAGANNNGGGLQDGGAGTGSAIPKGGADTSSVGHAAGRASAGANNNGGCLQDSKDRDAGTGSAIPKGGGSGGEGRRRIAIHLNGAGGRRARIGRLFEGFRFVLLGFGPTSKVQSKIIEMGGLVLNPAQYESSTHLCLMEEVKGGVDTKLVYGMGGKKIVTEQWIDKCCVDNAIFGSESEAEGTLVVSTGKKPRPLSLLTKGAAAVRRLSFDEDVDEGKVRRSLHQLFFCENDLTQNVMNLAAYGDMMKGKAGITSRCPGSNLSPAYCTTTIMEVKLLVKDVYLLLKMLNRAGYSLGGAFSAQNFVLVDGLDRKKAMFGQLEKGSLKRTNPDAEERDVQKFKLMVRTQVFRGILQPHDMTTWMSIIGSPELLELIPCHLFLLEDRDACNRFLGLCDTFKDEIEKYRYQHKKDVYDRIVMNLKAYDNWQKVLSAADSNEYLKQTFDHSKLPNSNITYANDVSGLLRLVRNSRHHASRGQHRLFLLIIGHHFPNLVFDVQVEMYKEGYKA